KELRPVAPVTDRQIDQWVADLDDRRFAVREKAMAALRKAGDQPASALRKILQEQPPLELRRRGLPRRARGHVVTPPVCRVRTLRALELLERLETPAARRLLQDLAGGAPRAWLTRQARAALGRPAAQAPPAR